MKELEIHPIADCLPNMPDELYESFKEDISGLGVLEPITLLDGKILDGRHRYRACQELGIECPTRIVSNISPNDLVRSMNLYRRHLNTSQQALVAAALIKPFEKYAKERQVATLKQGTKVPVPENFPERRNEDARDAVAKELGISGRTVSDGVVVLNEGTEEEIKEVKNGNAAVSTTAKEIRERRSPAEVVRKQPPGKMNQVNENIGWSAYSWNPVTGCKHGCEYCYAAAMSHRYGWTFDPQLREDRLDFPKNTKIKQDLNNRVFTCSMGELFGPWVPQEWIDKVFKVVRDNPQWTFLFLTKSPERLSELDWPENAWIGATIDLQKRVEPVTEAFLKIRNNNIKFVSCEPLLEEIILPDTLMDILDWLIIGAKSEGSRKIQPELIWIEQLLKQARDINIPVWFKDNLVYRPQEIPK